VALVNGKEGLGRLCRVYEQLDGREKEEVIRLAEGLLGTQKIMHDEKSTGVQVNPSSVPKIFINCPENQEMGDIS